MNEMVVKVIGTDYADEGDHQLSNPGGYGSNGSGSSAFNKI